MWCDAYVVPDRSSAGEESGKARNLGPVTSDTEQGDGWFWLDLAERSVDSDQLESAFLAPGDGSWLWRYQLIETIQDGNLLKIRVSTYAPRDGLFLSIPVRDKGLLEKIAP